MKRLLSSVLCPVMLLFTGISLSAGQLYDVTTFLPGFNPVAMNDNGQIVGSYNGENALYTPGKSIAELAFPSCSFGPVSESSISGLSNSGEVIGDYQEGVRPYFTFPFLYSHATGVRNLGTLGVPNTLAASATGINDNGDIVGYTFSGATFQSIPSEYKFGYGLVSLPIPTGQPHAINDNGQVIGVLGGPSSYDSFLYTPGRGITDVTTAVDQVQPGASQADALFLNNSGAVAGSLNLNPTPSPQCGNGEGFVFNPNGTVTFLNDGYTSSQITGLNNQGQVVGYWSNETADKYGNCSGSTVLGVYQNGVITNLSSAIGVNSGYTIGSVDGIDDLGQIFGSGVNSDGVEGAYVLTPVDSPSAKANVLPGLDAIPEPSTFLQMCDAAIFALMAGYRKFSRKRSLTAT